MTTWVLWSVLQKQHKKTLTYHFFYLGEVSLQQRVMKNMLDLYTTIFSERRKVHIILALEGLNET